MTQTDPATAAPQRYAVCVRRTRCGPWEPIVHAGSRELAERLMIDLAATMRMKGTRSLDFAVEQRPAGELDPRTAVGRQEGQEPRSADVPGNPPDRPEQFRSGVLDAKETK